MRLLSGRVAVVTGAANGIGLGLARRFAEEGMKVVIADVNEADLARAQRDLADFPDVVTQVTEVSDPAAIEALRDRTESAFGAVHVLCNNAGVGGYQRFETTDLSTWNWTVGVNLLGVVNGIRSFLPLLVQQEEAHIVNTAAVAGFIHSKHLAPYAATKAAVVALSESLAAELAEDHPNVGVSVLSPGRVDTNISDNEKNAPADVISRDEADPQLTAVRAEHAAAKRGAMSPATVAERVIRGMREGQLHILTHPEHAARFRTRADSILKAWG